MVVGVDNALSMSRAYWLSQRETVAEAKRVAEVLNQWHAHFAVVGVDQNTIDTLATQIDRSQLLEQRRALTK